VLKSNLENSTGMYSVGGTGGVMNAARLLAEGASPGVAILGIGVVAVMAVSAIQRALVRSVDAADGNASLVFCWRRPQWRRRSICDCWRRVSRGSREFALFLDVTLLVAVLPDWAHCTNPLKWRRSARRSSWLASRFLECSILWVRT